MIGARPEIRHAPSTASLEIIGAGVPVAGPDFASQLLELMSMESDLRVMDNRLRVAGHMGGSVPGLADQSADLELRIEDQRAAAIATVERMTGLSAKALRQILQ